MVKRPARKLCKCGCKEFVKPGNNFIYRHNSRGKNNPMYKGESDTKLKKYCECGCGKLVKHPKYSRFAHGHANKGKNNPFFGKKHTDEHKKRTSERMSGENHPWFGRKHAEKSKEKIRISRKGKYSGKDNPMWNGGNPQPYPYGWHNKNHREMIFERDGYKCQNPLCKRISSRLTRHHINYNKDDMSDRNIITLCHSCNTIAEGKGKDNRPKQFWQKHYEGIMKERAHDRHKIHTWRTWN